MGRAPCCDKASVKKGPWSPDEDETLRNFILTYGTGGNWIALPKKAGLRRCGKSCRLRWLNYLRPDIRHGSFTEDEDAVICSLYKEIGSRWSFIASHLKGRTDNDVKNYWNTKLKKKLLLSEKPIDDNLQKTGSITNADFDFPLPACTGFSTHDDMLAIMTAPITEHSTMYNVAGTFVPELLPSANTTCSSSNSSISTNASSSVSSLVKEEKDWNGGGGVVQGNGSLLDFGFGFAGDDGMAAGEGGGVWYQDGSMNYFNYICLDGVD